MKPNLGSHQIESKFEDPVSERSERMALIWRTDDDIQYIHLSTNSNSITSLIKPT